MSKKETFEDRINFIHKLLVGIDMFILIEICMDMTTKEFDKLENSVIILSETGNTDGMYMLSDSLLDDYEKDN